MTDFTEVRRLAEFCIARADFEEKEFEYNRSLIGADATTPSAAVRDAARIARSVLALTGEGGVVEAGTSMRDYLAGEMEVTGQDTRKIIAAWDAALARAKEAAR